MPEPTRNGALGACARRLALGLFVAAAVVIALLCISAANDAECEPRHIGKAAVLARVALVEPAWVPRSFLVAPQRASLTAAADASNAAARRHREEDVVSAVGLPAVLKPDEHGCRSAGVDLVRTPSELRAALERLHPCSSDARARDAVPVLAQAYVDGALEARVFATRASRGARTRASNPAACLTWRLDDAVDASDGSHQPLHAALARRVCTALDAALPHASAVALDLKATSWAALQRGELSILEINGAFGVPWTTARADAGVFSAAADAARWLGSRAAHGASRLASKQQGFLVAAAQRAAVEGRAAGARARAHRILRQAQHSPKNDWSTQATRNGTLLVKRLK